jgi:hypothetical protein
VLRFARAEQQNADKSHRQPFHFFHLIHLIMGVIAGLTRNPLVYFTSSITAFTAVSIERQPQPFEVLHALNSTARAATTMIFAVFIFLLF